MSEMTQKVYELVNSSLTRAEKIRTFAQLLEQLPENSSNVNPSKEKKEKKLTAEEQHARDVKMIRRV